MAASLLTDYGAAWVIPFFVGATLLREKSARPLRAILLGALPFACVFAFYHWRAFGSPFALAIRYSNPKMIAAAPGESLWGMFRFLPDTFALGKLLFGPERGILYTQPWLLGLFEIGRAHV